MSTAVKNYDTTLRDGTQGEGISFSVTDKLLIAEKLDQFGADYIEGGFPGSNPRDITFFQEAQKQKLKHARLAAFGSTRRAGTKPNEDTQLKTLLDSGMPVMTIVGRAVKEFGAEKVGVHCHNDSGLGVALSLAGVAAGATLVQGTMNGYGERVGNANMTTVLPNLFLKMGRTAHCAANLSQIRDL